jgi:hypothetical protein
MKRRTYLKCVAAGAGLIASERTGALKAANSGEKIQLHVDLAVDPAREQEMLSNFRTIFRPVAARQPGYINVEMLKLRSAIQGSAPANVNYRFIPPTPARNSARSGWRRTRIRTPGHLSRKP